MLTPPLNQCGVISCLITYFPIQLGHAVVQPTVVYPQQNIGIEVVVVLCAVGIATCGRTLLVAIDAEWRYTNLYPRFHIVDGLVELLDKQVHIIAAPIVLILETIRVIVEQLIVGNRLALHGIWVEVIVHVDAVYIVATHDVLSYLADIVAILLHTRIQYKQIVVSKTA